jgi:hypothetical protein
MPAIRISNGEEFALSNPIPNVEQAALAGARICRYAGRSKGVFWSVLIHSLIVCELLGSPVEKFFGLIHDISTESVIGDVLRPIKTDTIKEVEQQVYFRTLRNWRIPFPDKSVVAAVHEADILSYLGEIHTVAPEGHLPQYHRRIPVQVERLTRRYIVKAKRLNREDAEVREFLKKYYGLRKQAFGF